VDTDGEPSVAPNNDKRLIGFRSRVENIPNISDGFGLIKDINASREELKKSISVGQEEFKRKKLISASLGELVAGKEELKS
jgi:hypothetical protein